jgi:hypothetical protein
MPLSKMQCKLLERKNLWCCNVATYNYDSQLHATKEPNWNVYHFKQRFKKMKNFAFSRFFHIWSFLWCLTMEVPWMFDYLSQLSNFSPLRGKWICTYIYNVCNHCWPFPNKVIYIHMIDQHTFILHKFHWNFKFPSMKLLIFFNHFECVAWA